MSPTSPGLTRLSDADAWRLLVRAQTRIATAIAQLWPHSDAVFRKTVAVDGAFRRQVSVAGASLCATVRPHPSDLTRAADSDHAALDTTQTTTRKPRRAGQSAKRRSSRHWPPTAAYACQNPSPSPTG